jgi:hypothetical protein
MENEEKGLEGQYEESTVQPVTAPAPAPVRSLEQQYQKVKQERKKQEETVKNAAYVQQGAAEVLKQAEARLKALGDHEKALEQLVNQNEAIKANLEQRRRAAQGALQDAKDYLGELVKDLEAELSDAYRQHIDFAIAEEDQRIDTLRGDVDDLKQVVADAEEARAAAQAAATRAEVASRDMQTQLQQLGGRIQEAMTKLSQARQAAETADQNGQNGEAYYLVYEAAAAIQDLQAVGDPETEQKLRDALSASTQEAVAAREKTAQAQGELDAKKAELRAKESELQTAEKQRAANIQQKVGDFPEADMRSEPPAAPAAAA